MIFRDPPSNIEAEQALLGSILADNEAFYRVSPFLLDEHFFEPAHARLYASIAKLINAGRRATPITLKQQADDSGYLPRLAACALSPSMAEEMGRLVRDLATRRSLVTLGEQLAEQAYALPTEKSATDLIEASEASLAALASKGIQQRQVTLTDALADAVEVVAAAYKRDTGLVGLSTGLLDLDAKLGGLVPSELVILAGRPSMGKSALAANIAVDAAKAGHPVGFFSVEMSAQQIALRVLGEASRISAHRMRQGKISSADFDVILDAAQGLADLPIRFDETGGITVAQVAARARRWKRQFDIGLLVVDYLQLMRGSGRRDGRVQEVSEITTGLKALAKELAIPVMALSQLSRQVEGRDDKRPQLSDLRESGSIEQDADVVMFIYREEYYLARTEPKLGTAAYEDWRQRCGRASGKAEIIISKQRHGPTGTVEVAFNPELTKFSNLAQPRLMEAAE